MAYLSLRLSGNRKTVLPVAGASNSGVAGMKSCPSLVLNVVPPHWGCKIILARAKIILHPQWGGTTFRTRDGHDFIPATPEFDAPATGRTVFRFPDSLNDRYAMVLD